MSNQIYDRDGDEYEVPAPVTVVSVDAEVVQSTGASTTKVMSQAAVTNKLSELSDSMTSDEYLAFLSANLPSAEDLEV